MNPAPEQFDLSSQFSGNFESYRESYFKAMSDKDSRDKWIIKYLPLVKSLVGRFRYHFPERYETEDIYGVAVRALLIAVNRYDPSKGKSFGNYAGLRIKGALLDELRKIDHLPRANRAKAKSLQATIAKLESDLKRHPTEKEICHELNLSASEYARLLDQTQPITFIPIENGTSDDSGESTTVSETLHDPTDTSPLEDAEKQEKLSLLKDRLQLLPPKNRKILMLYYIEELRLSEIAQVFNLSEGRISQIISHSILSLKAHFQTLN